MLLNTQPVENVDPFVEIQMLVKRALHEVVL